MKDTKDNSTSGNGKGGRKKKEKDIKTGETEDV